MSAGRREGEAVGVTRRELGWRWEEAGSHPEPPKPRKWRPRAPLQAGGPNRCLYRKQWPQCQQEKGGQEPSLALETPDRAPWTLRAGHRASARPDLQPRRLPPGPRYEPQREGADHRPVSKALEREMGGFQGKENNGSQRRQCRELKKTKKFEFSLKVEKTMSPWTGGCGDQGGDTKELLGMKTRAQESNSDVTRKIYGLVDGRTY